MNYLFIIINTKFIIFIIFIFIIFRSIFEIIIS